MSNAIMYNVYNHYLTTYAPKSTTQYDTHKKSELRGIYNSIVKLNKESPWYLDTKSAETQQYAISLKENARLMANCCVTPLPLWAVWKKNSHWRRKRPTPPILTA